MDDEGNMLTDDQLDTNFKYVIENEPGGDSFLKCFQCGTCTASCPVREVDNTFNPRKIIRLIKLGAKDEVFRSKFVWMCSACYSCYERCPQDVDITSFMTTLKNLAVKQGYAPSGLTGLLDLLNDFGALGEITDFENTIRSKFNIEEIQQSPDNVKKALKESRIKEIIEGES